MSAPGLSRRLSACSGEESDSEERGTHSVRGPTIPTDSSLFLCSMKTSWLPQKAHNNNALINRLPRLGEFAVSRNPMEETASVAILANVLGLSLSLFFPFPVLTVKIHLRHRTHE